MRGSALKFTVPRAPTDVHQQRPDSKHRRRLLPPAVTVDTPMFRASSDGVGAPPAGSHACNDRAMINDELETLLGAVDKVQEHYFSEYPGGWGGQISTALVDAVFSIRARYWAKDPEKGVIGRLRRFRCLHPKAQDDLSLLVDVGPDELREIMGNTRTFTRHKSEAVMDAAERFLAAGVVHAEDFLSIDPRQMKRVYTSVPGLGWVTFEYFSMLLGRPGVKADSMITRFVSQALGGDVTPQKARMLIGAAYERVDKGESLTHFEHGIWKYQSDLASSNRRAS